MNEVESTAQSEISPAQKHAIKGCLSVIVLVFIIGAVYGALTDSSHDSLFYTTYRPERAFAYGMAAVFILAAIAIAVMVVSAVAYLIFVW